MNPEHTFQALENAYQRGDFLEARGHLNVDTDVEEQMKRIAEIKHALGFDRLLTAVGVGMFIIWISALNLAL